MIDPPTNSPHPLRILMLLTCLLLLPSSASSSRSSRTSDAYAAATTPAIPSNAPANPTTTTTRISSSDDDDELTAKLSTLASALVSPSPETLNVHIVPHSHDDAGWLKTFDQYYHGYNSSITSGNVSSILDTTIDALQNDPERRFVYSEMSFFAKWWHGQDEKRKELVRTLVREHRLSFANGGYVMHDEAVTHYIAMTDQTTLGHAFLKSEFGISPRSGWQLDPFGHSVTQAGLMTEGMGFDAVYLGRMDYRDLEQRIDRRQVEGLWRPSHGSSNSNDRGPVFWSKTGSYVNPYNAPHGYCFDVRCNHPADPITADTAKFVERLIWQADATIGHNIMLTWGGDFQYENATRTFEAGETFFGRVRNDLADGTIDAGVLGGKYDAINFFYSSPDIYTRAKHDEWTRRRLDGGPPDQEAKGGNNSVSKSTTAEWEVKHDDFFPYAMKEHDYWTGYYTSRPTLKRMDRVASCFLMAARQVDAMVRLNSLVEDKSTATAATESPPPPIEELEKASAILQHHDAVTGTAKQHVTLDYIKRVDRGIKEAAEYVSASLSTLMGGGGGGGRSIQLTFCQYLNETKCDITQDATTDPDGGGKDLYAVVYNALGQERFDEIVSIPVSSDATYEVRLISSTDDEKGSGGRALKSVLMPSFPGMKSDGTSIDGEAAPYVLHIETTVLPPVGGIVLRVRIVGGDSSVIRPSETSCHLAQDGPSSRFTVSNGALDIAFDPNGSMRQILKIDTGVTLDFNQAWGYYTAFADFIKKHRDSDAYMFRPVQDGDSDPLTSLDPICDGTAVYQSDLVTEVHSRFSGSMVRQVTRIKKGVKYVEIEYNVGPLPIADNTGKELVTRYRTSISSNGLFYTDANARELVPRRRNERSSWNLSIFDEPIAGNYYPVTAAMYIEDESSSFAVLTDRSQGGTSLVDGDVELLVHRRTATKAVHDTREALNETDGLVEAYPPFGTSTVHGQGIVVSGVHRLYFGKGNQGASIARLGMDRAFSPPLLFFGTSVNRDSATIFPKASAVSALGRALPDNVMLITFARIQPPFEDGNDKYLLRLAHQYGAGEDILLSQPVVIDLSKLFNSHVLTVVSEMTLSGNQRRDDWTRRKLSWSLADAAAQVTASKDAGTAIELKPMEIRTFEVKLEPVYASNDKDIAKGHARGQANQQSKTRTPTTLVLAMTTALILVLSVRMKWKRDHGLHGYQHERVLDMDELDLDVDRGQCS